LLLIKPNGRVHSSKASFRNHSSTKIPPQLLLIKPNGAPGRLSVVCFPTYQQTAEK
jgi:hypothetical protein